MTHRALITQMLDVLIQHPTDDGYKDQRWEAILAARVYLAAPEEPDDYDRGFRMGLEASTSYREEAKAYKESYFKLLENIANLKSMELPAPIILTHPAPKAEPVKAGAIQEVLRQVIHGDFSTDVPENLALALNAKAELHTLTNPAPKAEPSQAQIKAAAKAEQSEPLTDEEIDVITVSQWGKYAILPAHRAYARAVLAAQGAKT